MKSKTEHVNIQHDASYNNLYKVPVKVWRKWSKPARWVFNDLYDCLLRNDQLWFPPKLYKAKTVKPFELKVLAWNAAWLAAEAVDDEKGKWTAKGAKK